MNKIYFPADTSESYDIEEVIAVQWRGDNREELLRFCKKNLVFSKTKRMLPTAPYKQLWFKMGAKTIVLEPNDWVVRYKKKFIPYHNRNFEDYYVEK